MQCIANLKAEGSITMEVALASKMELEATTRRLMPGGKVNYRDLPKYPAIAQLIPTVGEPTMQKILFLLVYDFCRSVNVVRNMDEVQMIEAAGYLMDECGNFRLEDYVCMFTMAKRGQLMKIMDRVDISLIGEMLDAYWKLRDLAGKQIQEKEVREIDKFFNSSDIGFSPEMQKLVDDFKQKVKDIPDHEPVRKPLKTTPEQAQEIIEGIAKSEKLKQGTDA